jgi:flagellar protein FliS
MYTNKAINQYAAINKQTSVEDVNPHQLIMLLFNGAIDNLVRAGGCMQRKDYAGKGETLGRALTIIGGLQGFLDMDQGGDVARNLDSLYDYMQRRLYEATRDNDNKIVDEVINLLREIRAGWEGIGQEAKELLAQQGKAV